MSARIRPYDVVKRALDVVASAVALVVLSPVIIATAVLVAVRLGRPVVFAQKRPGKDGRIFTLYKFRSMRSVDESRGWVTDADRLTSFGRRLRSTSLDELPSLWNILRGEMSFVGPRPLRVSYLERYSPEQNERHTVRPGLTGLAQVNGRNALAWDDRLDLDLEYVRRRSVGLDARVIFETFRTVLAREGISAEATATMTEFFGPESTSRLRFVELDETHLEARVDWLSDERVRSGISLGFDPDIESMRAWLPRVRDDASRSDWVATERSDGRPIAMCGLQFGADRSASLYIYVAPDEHRKGYGRETMMLLITRARRAGVRSLELETPRSNAAARRLYDDLGFIVVGETDEGRKIKMTKPITSGHGNG